MDYACGPYNLAAACPGGRRKTARRPSRTDITYIGGCDNASYLTEAQRIATTAMGRYFDAGTGRINDEGYWVFELVDALDDLYLADHNPYWVNKVDAALAWLDANKRDPNGPYGLFWGRNGAPVGQLDSWSSTCRRRSRVPTSRHLLRFCPGTSTLTAT